MIQLRIIFSKIPLRQLLLIILFLGLAFFNHAQDTKAIVHRIQELMEERYVFLDKAKETNAHLDKLLAEKHFDQFKSPEELATALRSELQSVTKDKHLRVYPPRVIQDRPDEAPNYMRGMSRYYGPIIRGFEYVSDNVGYFDMRFFGGGDRHFDKVDAVMQQLDVADAIIIDMRYNGGGSPRMVRYLCSYFFSEEDKLIQSIYSRFDNQLIEYFTQEVKGRKRPKVPVFILTGERTFSAAEAFTYAMQSFDRAKIIGAVTRGGAHPNRTHPLPGGLRVSIPFARSIDPNTKTNWEGTGIQPDVLTETDKALEKAIELAKEAAKTYQASFFDPLLDKLKTLGNNPLNQNVEQSVFEQLVEAKKLGVLHQTDINRLGWNFQINEQSTAAVLLLKANTKLYPKSPVSFDNYAEILAETGKVKEAIKNYQKAIDLAKAQDHIDLEVFQRHLKELEEK